MRYFRRVIDWIAYSVRVGAKGSCFRELLKDCFGETPKSTRETRVLPKIVRSRVFLIFGLIFAGTVFSFLFIGIPASLQTPAVGTLRLLDCRGRELAEIASPEARAQLPRKIEQMGTWLPQITVALEDHRFFDHGAVDWRAVAGAGARNVRSGRIISGGSTITQQLVKLAVGRQHRSWLGKAYETVIAWKIERRWGKQQILAEYLNRSSYGNRRLGPEAAARAYFGKSANELTLAEAIYLAGLPQAPTRLNPWTHPQDAARKYQRSLKRLAQLNVITGDEQALLQQSPPVVRRFDPPKLAPHFVDAVIAQHPGLRGTIRTTLDVDLQEKAERLVRTHVAALNRHDISQAAMVILDNDTGAVRAMVGSDNYAFSQINGARRPRSCGSTLKPFVYLRAIDERLLTAASLLPDTPDAIRDEYADYDPQNYNHRYLGPVRVREALGCSLNVPAVYTLSRLGARQTFFELQKWGFQFPRRLNDYGAGFILGNAEIRLVDLAGAYAGLARKGAAMRAKFLATEQFPVREVASAEATAIVTDILCDNRAREKTFGTHSPLAFEQRVAVKTGTSSGFRDAWTVGFNKQHTIAVWAGNFDGRPMRDTFAVRSATPLWSAMMHELLRRDEPLDPPGLSERLVRREICAETGLLSVASQGSTMTELFLKGTEPTGNSADWFDGDGKLMLPNEYAVWCRSADNVQGAQVRPEPRITNPVANAHYEIDPALSRSQQAIELTATLGNNVKWFVNGDELLAHRDGRFFLPLTPGAWTLRAVSASGSAEETITVD